VREGTNDFKPTEEMKLRAWEYMKKHALPRMIEAERKKQSEGEDHGRTGPGEKED
jgi:50S ribosomal subunit-associated GTPase HflX